MYVAVWKEPVNLPGINLRQTRNVPFSSFFMASDLLLQGSLQTVGAIRPFVRSRSRKVERNVRLFQHVVDGWLAGRTRTKGGSRKEYT